MNCDLRHMRRGRFNEDCPKVRPPEDLNVGAWQTEKARRLFEALKREKGEGSESEEFVASRGWFMRFKDRAHFHNIKGQGEAASADEKAATEFPNELAKIIEECGYCAQQVFNVDETGLFWKRPIVSCPLTPCGAEATSPARQVHKRRDRWSWAPNNGFAHSQLQRKDWSHPEARPGDVSTRLRCLRTQRRRDLRSAVDFAKVGALGLHLGAHGTDRATQGQGYRRSKFETRPFVVAPTDGFANLQLQGKA
ncbi:hypothetical protein C0Q70_15151 [Pomacea canaliculata]|uniref:HTH CENPB-type domain-containing protein n=1 Tax=Pomacea canaliculata TaxID=400727 RepID=A0A2T7NU42_POMCA|nr:hypothetical protein C0Q70_15151 [Pomacea canaliculata]